MLFKTRSNSYANVSGSDPYWDSKFLNENTVQSKSVEDFPGVDNT